MRMYSTITTKHFILELISFLVKIWHVISHLVTTPLVLMTACILFGIVEYRAFRSSVFKVYQIYKAFLYMSVFYIWHPLNVTLYNAPESLYGAQI